MKSERMLKRTREGVRGNGLMRRLITPFVVATTAVVGLAAPSSAHHPVVDGSYKCDPALGDKFDLTFTVASDADYNKDWSLVAVSTSPSNLALTWNRPVTTDTDDQNDFVATVQDVPAGTYTLNVTARWHKKGYPDKEVVTQTGSKTLKPSGDCKKEVPVPPQPPSQDLCNPPGVTNNVTWVPETGPADDDKYNWTLNNDGSLTVTPQPGKKFPGQQQSVTYYKPKDSGELCPQSVPGSATATPTACSAPGQSTGSATVTVTNTDDRTDESETYTVTMGNQVKSITLADGASGTVTFSGLAAGNITWSVVGDDGTKVNNTVTVAACVVTTPPVPPTPPTPPTDACPYNPGNQPVGTDCSPEPVNVVKVRSTLVSNCLTARLGEFSAYAKNYGISTSPVWVKVFVNGHLDAHKKLRPGKSYGATAIVNVGSKVRLVVKTKSGMLDVKRTTVPDGCGGSTHDGGLRTQQSAAG